MEHIIQFGVNIDDEKIVEVATNKAASMVVGRIQKEVYDFTRGYNSKLDRMFLDEIKKVIDENKERIIEDATKRLTENMTKTKAVREMIKKLEAGD